MRGRKAELKAVDGGLAGVPRPPESIPVDFRKEWTAIVKEMRDRKILTETTLGIIETFIIARWSAREAQKAIVEHGALVEGAHKALKPNPATGLLSKSMETVARLSAELGISPAARSKASFQAKGPKANGAPEGLDI